MQKNGWVGRTEIPAMQQKVTQMEGFYFHFQGNFIYMKMAGQTKTSCSLKCIRCVAYKLSRMGRGGYRFVYSL